MNGLENIKHAISVKNVLDSCLGGSCLINLAISFSSNVIPISSAIVLTSDSFSGWDNISSDSNKFCVDRIISKSQLQYDTVLYFWFNILPQ